MSGTDSPRVFVVDDDHAVRKTLVRSLKLHGYAVKAFKSAESFLASVDANQPGCLILDVAMPAMTGPELQSRLLEKEYVLPIIFISGHGDIPTSVRAIKNGAIEFLEKPYRQETLLGSVEEALAYDAENRSTQDNKAELLERFAQLTPREHEVMTLLVSSGGERSNKDVAHKLGISHRTVDEYRANVMRKIQTKTITQLIDACKTAGII